jgi:hypothetical protein
MNQLTSQLKTIPPDRTGPAWLLVSEIAHALSESTGLNLKNDNDGVSIKGYSITECQYRGEIHEYVHINYYGASITIQVVRNTN